MKFIPDSISRMVAARAMTVKKNSPSILLGAGVASMVGSTVLACRATLKLEDVLAAVEHDLNMAKNVHELANNGEVEQDYSDQDLQKDSYIIYARGVGNVVKLYAPSVILGGVGVLCLTKSHRIMQDRNAALTAAYVAVDRAFKSYRERVIDRYGEETDRELRYDAEDVDIIDDETGKVISTYRPVEGEHGLYARWFDKDNNNWNEPSQQEYNWLFLRNQQNWVNDMLKARGHVFLNEVYSCLGLSHTSAGAAVGWVYDRNNENGDNFIDFGCWDQKDLPDQFFNGREGAILLDFNVDGPIWQLIDERTGGS